jgi:hypothetical protein
MREGEAVIILAVIILRGGNYTVIQELAMGRKGFCANLRIISKLNESEILLTVAQDGRCEREFSSSFTSSTMWGLQCSVHIVVSVNTNADVDTYLVNSLLSMRNAHHFEVSGTEDCQF